MKWIGRIILGLLGIVALLIIVLGAVVVWDVNFGEMGTDFTNVTYAAQDGTELDAYLVTPEGEGPFPAVIMVHEWWGLNGEITELADELAEEGYVVLAPDVYRGPLASTIPGALYLRLNVDMERVDQDMLAAYDYLANLPQVEGGIGVVGFCFGGDVAFNHGIANPQIDAVINLYGSTFADTSAFGALLEDPAPPVLGIFGAEDQSIPLEEVSAYEAALQDAGVAHTITVYDGMGHAFVQPGAIEDEGAPRQAWREILDFFDTHLRETDAG